jgi:hypothetical protein
MPTAFRAVVRATPTAHLAAPMHCARAFAFSLAVVDRLGYNFAFAVGV